MQMYCLNKTLKQHIARSGITPAVSGCSSLLHHCRTEVVYLPQLSVICSFLMDGLYLLLK